MSDKKGPSMFAKLAEQAKVTHTETAPASEVIEDIPPALPTRIDKPKRAAAKAPDKPVRGKRDNPDYVQANGYILKKVKRAVERELLDFEGLDYGGLVEDLLRKWLKSRDVIV